MRIDRVHLDKGLIRSGCKRIHANGFRSTPLGTWTVPRPIQKKVHTSPDVASAFHYLLISGGTSAPSWCCPVEAGSAAHSLWQKCRRAAASQIAKPSYAVPASLRSEGSTIRCGVSSSCSRRRRRRRRWKSGDSASAGADAGARGEDGGEDEGEGEGKHTGGILDKGSTIRIGWARLIHNAALDRAM